MQNEALAQCQQQLAQVKKEFDEFIYLVSHDLNAPIRAISNLSGWIAEDLGADLPPEVQQNIMLLQDRAHRLEKMLGAILQLSRVSRTDLDTAPIELHGFLNKISQKYPVATILVNLKEAPTTFTTYFKKLQVVLEILVENAVKHTDQAKVNVQVTVQQNGQWLEFEIQDNGLGIPADAGEKIFMLFYTVNSKEGNDNLGAGLTIARSITRFVGGNLTLKHALEGKGSCFLLQWPLMVN